MFWKLILGVQSRCGWKMSSIFAVIETIKFIEPMVIVYPIFGNCGHESKLYISFMFKAQIMVLQSIFGYGTHFLGFSFWSLICNII